MPTPLVLLGDHPALPSGLGRILRDLAQHLADDRSLDLEVAVVGWRPGGMGQDGTPRTGIPTWTFSDTEGDQEGAAADALPLAWQEWFGSRPGIVLTVWDPARCYGLAQLDGPWELWGYVPLDAPMVGERLFGPAAAALQRYTRLLAYTRWGSRLLKTCVSGPVEYLPHGLDPSWWQPVEKEWTDYPGRIVGIVATNQPRKDWFTALATVAELRARGHKVIAWAHTDRAVGPAWSLPHLIDGLNLQKRVRLTLAGPQWTDRVLAGCYRQCSVTVHPGLGEGFGYPIVESLACGTPSVHLTEGGGAELVPRREWRIPHRGRRVEGAHALIRPVITSEDLANAVERAWKWQESWEDRGAAYCQGSVAHLAWPSLWPRWRSWVRAGLEEQG